MTIINNEGPLGRSLHIFTCDRVNEISGLVDLSDKHLAILLILDAKDIDSNVISNVADALLSSGLVYLCVWGPDCERVHDIFDEVYVGDGLGLENKVSFLSTWHSKESLADTLWFFLNNTDIDDELDDPVTAGVSIVVNNETWRTQIQNWLQDLHSLNLDVGLSS